MKRFIYADNAATTKLDIDAFEAMRPFLLEEYGNPSQLYSFAKSPKRAIKQARETIANCIGAQPEEIYFTSGGTESDNWAIKGTVFSSGDKSEIVTSAFEHHAILHTCRAVEHLGYNVRYIAPTEKGYIEPETLSETITNQTRLVSIMFANNELGTIQPIKELCRVAHSKGALFHTDAVQAVGHVPIDVEALGVDLLSASAHKFNGPKGTGFLYIRNGVTISPFSDGGAQERRMRAGTENVAAIIGMATALKKNCDNIQQNYTYVAHLQALLLEELTRSNVAYKHNVSGNILPGVLSLSFEGGSGEAIMHRLDLMGICVSTGSACDSKRTQISHVLKAIHLNPDVAEKTIRISLSRDNTEKDILDIVAALKKILG